MATRLATMIRRLAVAASPGGLWQVVAGGDESPLTDVPLFQGVGISARPSADSGGAEAIVVKVGGDQRHPVIVATRDESVRLDVEEDETAIYNSGSVVLIKADGTVEVRSRGGSAQALATKADVDALQTAVDAHIHTTTATVGAGATPGVISPPVEPMPSATGTQKLKGE